MDSWGRGHILLRLLLAESQQTMSYRAEMSAWGSRVGEAYLFFKRQSWECQVFSCSSGAKDFSEIVRHQMVGSGMLKLKLSRA